MKNMKKLLAVALLSMSAMSSMQAIDKKAFTRDKTHAGICADNTLGVLSCYEKCPRSGWTGKAVLVNGKLDGKKFRGVACLCGNNTVEKISLRSKAPMRCGTTGAGSVGAGLPKGAIDIYSMKEGKFITVPSGQAYDESTGKFVKDSSVKVKFAMESTPEEEEAATVEEEA